MLNKFMRFMYGRYGTDELNRFLMITVFILLIISLIFSRLFSGIVSLILNPIIILLLTLAMFRMLSKNINRRRQEQIQYLKIRNKVKKPIDFLWQKFSQRKTHRIYRCKNCKATVRVPKGKGKIKITCPKCKATFIKKS